MIKEFDPKKSYLTIKAHEKMVAYIGFLFKLEGHASSKDGVIKISSFRRPYGGGYLTLTFIVDTENNQEIKQHLDEVFKDLTEDSLRPYLGKSMERLVKVSLDSLAQVREWYVEEVNVHFRTLKESDRVMIKEELIPALECVLPFSYDSVEWWPEERPIAEPAEEHMEEEVSLKTFFRKWFGGRHFRSLR